MTARGNRATNPLDKNPAKIKRPAAIKSKKIFLFALNPRISINTDAIVNMPMVFSSILFLYDQEVRGMIIQKRKGSQLKFANWRSGLKMDFQIKVIK